MFEAGLEMKYFVLKPRSKYVDDPYAKASRAAMKAYAESLKAEENTLLNDFIHDLLDWINQEEVLEKAYSSNIK